MRRIRQTAVGEGVCAKKVAELIMHCRYRQAGMQQEGKPPNGPHKNKNQRSWERFCQPLHCQNFPLGCQPMTPGARNSGEAKRKPILGTKTIRFPCSRPRRITPATWSIPAQQYKLGRLLRFVRDASGCLPTLRKSQQIQRAAFSSGISSSRSFASKTNGLPPNLNRNPSLHPRNCVPGRALSELSSALTLPGS